MCSDMWRYVAMCGDVWRCVCVYRFEQHKGRQPLDEHISFDLDFAEVCLVRVEYAHAQDDVAFCLDEHHQRTDLAHGLEGTVRRP